jgi:hypothetical protein
MGGVAIFQLRISCHAGDNEAKVDTAARQPGKPRKPSTPAHLPGLRWVPDSAPGLLALSLMLLYLWGVRGKLADSINWCVDLALFCVPRYFPP